ncbi:MAG: response regulator [Candidatus Micrarchaeia archaeon]|jgi:DNA-binding NtrC family response regulator
MMQTIRGAPEGLQFRKLPMPLHMLPLVEASSKRAVLIIENNREFLGTLKFFLRYGPSISRVLTAENYEDAMRIFNERKSEIGLVVTDMGFPVAAGDRDSLAGLKLIAAVKELAPKMPIIAMSGRPEVLGLAKEAGADAVFAKMKMLSEEARLPRAVAGLMKKKE